MKLKKLNSKGYDGPDLVDQLVLQNPDAAKEKLRNICAFISPALFADVEGLCSLLDLSKREVVQMALVDLVKKAGKIVDQVNPFNEAQAQEEHA